MEWTQWSGTLALTSVNEEQTRSGNGIPANAILLDSLEPITICIYTVKYRKLQPYLPPGPRLLMPPALAPGYILEYSTHPFPIALFYPP